MKKIGIFTLILLIFIGILKISRNYNLPNNIQDICNYCIQNGYNENYCLLVDFSKHSGQHRFYVYDIKNSKICHKSLCAHGLGVCKNNFELFIQSFKTRNNPILSNEIGSNYSCLGKFKVGKLRHMSNPYFEEGYTLRGLDTSNSNTFDRAILIHRGNLNFETFPLPCLPVSKGCFAISSSAVEYIKQIDQTKPLLLYAYK